MDLAAYLGLGRLGVLVVVVLVAALFDHRARRVPNWLTVPAALAGLGAHLAVGEGARVGILLGCLACLLALLYRRGAIGGGDLKLCVAIMALGGWPLGPETISFGFAFAVPMVLWDALRARDLGGTLKRAGKLLWLEAVPTATVDPALVERGRRIPFAVALALGCLGALAWERFGPASGLGG